MTEAPDSNRTEHIVEGSTRESAEILQSLWDGVETVVSGSFLFRSLDADGRRSLIGTSVVMVFPARHVILTEGEASTDFYLVDRGVIEITTRAPDGSTVALSTLQRGAFFGEVGMLTGVLRTATVTALTDVSVVRFSKEHIDAVLDRDPSARRVLVAMVEGRARDTAEKVVRALL